MNHAPASNNSGRQRRTGIKNYHLHEEAMPVRGNSLREPPASTRPLVHTLSVGMNSDGSDWDNIIFTDRRLSSHPWYVRHDVRGGHSRGEILTDNQFSEDERSWVASGYRRDANAGPIVQYSSFGHKVRATDDPKMVKFLSTKRAPVRSCDIRADDQDDVEPEPAEVRFEKYLPALRRVFEKNYKRAFGGDDADYCVMIDAFADFMTDNGLYDELEFMDLTDLVEYIWDTRDENPGRLKCRSVRTLHPVADPGARYTDFGFRSNSKKKTPPYGIDWDACINWDSVNKSLADPQARAVLLPIIEKMKPAVKGSRFRSRSAKRRLAVKKPRFKK